MCVCVCVCVGNKKSLTHQACIIILIQNLYN